MDIKEIKALIDKINESNIAYFEVKIGDGFIKMDKSLTRNNNETNELKRETEVVEEVVLSNKKTETIREEIDIKEELIDDKDIVVVKAPIVGSFYKSAAPDKPAFVEIGSKIKKGQVLCIIEAMKLMNEIESDVDGEIVEIMVNNEDMVEYGAPLFKIRRA
ncbi:biotin carboxyl carrier protein [Clostridium cavendishii DSM 21758]|uniref:Biotin carboxyl carrier protein of acetyl-CoA carboxylase n=1 Tax=Clostridium cavendishii DSM 21758 TaxID=1121302 RepID=A0A1M6KHF6_9CLOT|nr:acetyl-CoA carboxylase biotin carboxyl carrier protein [Clostridium cavendishii]SHJ58322.1 biotin carboxyl carrier protein [Clostridium cavendishii DSM 21758]